MSKDNAIIVGIDIGTSNVRAVIAQYGKNEEQSRIIGVGSASSVGIRRGMITDVDDVSKVINDVVEGAERMAGMPVKYAAVNIGGGEISFQNSKGVIAIGRADGEVTEDDINRVIAEAQVISLPMNKEIVHVIPRKYRLDDQDNIKDPLGMKGVRLEVETMIIESSASQVKNISKCVYQAGIEVEDLVLEPLACAKAVLSKKQKELGVVLVNIGGGTTSVAVFEEGELLHTTILPVGAGHVTNDIAIGLRTSVEVAERIKLEYGCALSREIDKNEGIDLSMFDSQESDVVSRQHVAEIIEARLEEIFQLVQNELKNIGKAGLLPSGAVLVGGGSKMPQVAELAKEVLRLPIQIGFPVGFGGVLDKIDDPSFATAAGLILWQEELQENGARGAKGGVGGMGLKSLNTFSKGTGEAVDKVRDWMKKFLP
ncbi:MAG TPA: cell division protein FtsA [Patescibacteria group bacterium]